MVNPTLMFHLVTTANARKMMNYCSVKIDLNFALVIPIYASVTLFIKIRYIECEAWMGLNFLPLAFIFNGEILSLRHRGSKETSGAFMDTRRSTRFSDIYTDIRERSLLLATRTYFFGIRDIGKAILKKDLF